MTAFDYNSVDWDQTFARIKEGPRGTLRQIASEIKMSHQRLSLIYNRWLKDPTYDPRIKQWGGNNRVFSQEEEATILQALIADVGSKGFAVPGSRIKEVFSALYQQKHSRRTRKHDFSASNGFLYNLSIRCKLSGRRSQKHRKKDPNSEEIKAYKERMREIFETFPPDRIFNSDETPIHVCPTTVYTTQFRGEQTPAIRCNGNSKDVVTAMATVSADGKAWPLTIVAKGTTPKVIRNLDLPDDVWREFSASGKTNTEICVRHVERISKFADEFPCALIWDGYKAHWTAEVQEEADRKDVMLVQVPDNATSECQPLDTGVFPAVSSKHQALLRQLDVFEKKPLAARKDAITLYHRAWKGIGKRVIKKAFQQVVK